MKKKFKVINKTESNKYFITTKRRLDAFIYDAVILNYRAGLDVGCKLRVVGSW